MAGAPLDASNKALLKGMVQVLRHADKTTMIVSRTNEPTMHNVDPLIAEIILRLDNIYDGSDLESFATIFKEDILNRRKELIDAQPIFELCV